MKIKASAGATHPGSRPYNEDAILQSERVPLFAVADGMGGPGAGDVAASIALEVIRRNSKQLRARNEVVEHDRTTENRLALSTAVDGWFNSASREIAEEATQLGVPGMGATLLVATVVGNFAYIAHVGDSRAYILREGGLLRLTEDHSVAEFRLRRGKITLEQYSISPERHVLYQALGAGEVDVDLAEVRLADGDHLLLCTDGLVRALDEQRIAELIDPTQAPVDSVRALLNAANATGAPDNLTAVLLAIQAEDGDEPIQAVTDVMEQVFLFQSLSHQHRLVMAPYLEEVLYEKGARIIREGDPGDCFFVVVSGMVRVTKRGTKLVDIGPGGHLGELALTRPVRRSASAVALQPTRLLSLSRERFHELVQHKPELGARLALELLDAVGDRLRDLSERLSDVERAARGELRRPHPNRGKRGVRGLGRKGD